MWQEGEMAAALMQMSLGFRGFLAVRSRVGGSGLLNGLWGQMRVFSVEENPFYSKYRQKIEELRRYSYQFPISIIFPPGLFLLWQCLAKCSFCILQGETFHQIWTRAQSCPAFLYALPRAEGYEFFVGQWSGTELHFTSLINIQSVGDAAPSQLILYHYVELQKEKGIILMTSELDSKFLSVQEAQCLASQVQLFYSGDSFHLVETFNHLPSSFKYMSVISVLEQNGLGMVKANQE
ncbi:ATP synthase mitochondrial F1 complex assembly factor 1 [Pyxicephalus adspersus]|uniref:ATP synthase mitochondrial F1 complex assembly factor 1 n=1 Tax=Pyxicephalus adspersus TaxID=30357 RepID=UPI003B59AFE9